MMEYNVSGPIPTAKGGTSMDRNTQPEAQAELDRARSDYLAVSRGAHLYGNDVAHADAESRAWERLERALMAVQAVESAEH
jgi:hypothetical protein